MSPQEKAALAKAIVDEVMKRIRLPEFHPATVNSVAANGDATVTLAVDKDADPPVTVTLESLVPGLQEGDSVMVVHHPPRGGFVLGVKQTSA